ncbi:MAG: hypothetical protein LBH32_06025 [Dysgonamonadaceae bacterium]|jgi:hypothetical protein|nr:hypothetical protein [Dysgonamonadaceae bacterium]
MKKYILFFVAIAAFVFQSCEKELDPGGTAVEKVAGDWWVTNQQSVDEELYIFEGEGAMPNEDDIENWNWESIYDTNYSHIYTYNTAANVPTEMFVEDGGSFWDYKVKVKLNYDAKTFEVPTTDNLAYEDCKVTIIKGKILLGAATTPSGMPADSIVFYVKFSDDPYGFTYTKVSGFRRTGFPADDF